MNARVWKKTLWLMSVILLCWGYCPGWGNAVDNPQTYTDSHGYFSFTSPPGWVQKDFPGESRGRIRFTSPDTKATMSIIVQPAEPGETFEKLLAKKRDLVEKLRQEKPEGKFGLKEDKVCQFKCIRIDTEFPGTLIQENYLFTERNLQVTFSCGAADKGNLEKYRQTALKSFCTIKLKK